MIVLWRKRWDEENETSPDSKVRCLMIDRSSDHVMRIIDQLSTSPRASSWVRECYSRCLWGFERGTQCLCRWESVLSQRLAAAANTHPRQRRIESNTLTWSCSHPHSSMTDGNSRLYSYSALHPFIFSHLFFTAAAASRLPPSCLPPSPCSNARAHIRERARRPPAALPSNRARAEVFFFS